MPVGEAGAAVADHRPHAVLGLLDGHVGQADERAGQDASKRQSRLLIALFQRHGAVGAGSDVKLVAFR